MQSSYLYFKSIEAILLFLWNPKLFPSSQDRSFACAKSPLPLRIHPNRREREGMKPREILQRYPKEKAESLMKNLLDRGLWYWDDDFPRDAEGS